MTTTLTFTIPPDLWLSANQPCERCVFVPTPDGRCICRGDKS